MPSIYITRLIVVATGLCSALAGKAFADSTGPPIGDSNHQETLGQYLDTIGLTEVLGGNETGTLQAVQLVWQDGRNVFNITMDSCVPKDAIVGIYQFSNGTSKNDATIYDISQDLLEFAGWNSYPTRGRRFAHQAIKNAQLAVDDINAFLSNNHTLCGSVSVSGNDKTELRRLLVDPDDLADGYWVAVIMKGVVASISSNLLVAVTGGTSFFNATSSHYFLGTILPFGGVILTGLIDQAQRQGYLNWLGALLGSVVSALMRKLVGLAVSIGIIDECNSDVESNFDGLSLASYTTVMSEFDSEHPDQGPQCPV